MWNKSFLLLSFQKPITVFVMHYLGLVLTLAVLQSVLSTNVSSSVSCWQMIHHVVLNAVFRWDVMTHGSSVKGLYQSAFPWISQLNGCCFMHISYQPSSVWPWPDDVTVQHVIFFLTKDGNVIIHNTLISRIHLQCCVEDEERCRLLITDLRRQIQLAFAEDIHDEEVLDEQYIRRVLHFRKVTWEASKHKKNIVTLNFNVYYQ